MRGMFWSGVRDSEGKILNAELWILKSIVFKHGLAYCVIHLQGIHARTGNGFP
jgi:hypothetical protein